MVALSFSNSISLMPPCFYLNLIPTFLNSIAWGIILASLPALLLSLNFTMHCFPQQSMQMTLQMTESFAVCKKSKWWWWDDDCFIWCLFFKFQNTLKKNKNKKGQPTIPTPIPAREKNNLPFPWTTRNITNKLNHITCSKFEDNHHCHDGPHSHTPRHCFKQWIHEIEEGNKNKCDSDFYRMQNSPWILCSKPPNHLAHWIKTGLPAA